jgi:microcystin degradation protein MlrC
VTMRVFAGGVATETNVFSPIPTGLRDFALARPSDAQETRDRVMGGTVFARFAAVAASRDCKYVQGTYAFAIPAGITTRAAYEGLRDALLIELENALPVDCVLLGLHGAMVADGYEDCETDIVLRVRRLVGGEAKVGVLLDLHCDIPDSLLELADVIVTYKEYPHVDSDDRGEELARLTLDAAAGQVNPRMAVFDCRMVGLYPTPPEPMHSFVERMKEAEQRPGVLSVSLGHGFPWGDAPEMGARMLVVSDGEPGIASAVAAELGTQFWALRAEVTLKPLPMGIALDRALSTRALRPVVVADVSDNAGGGAPSDSTFVLQELLQRRVESAALALLWDPVAVEQAFAAGAGAMLTLRLGGKIGPASGEPLDLTVQVRGLVPDLVQRWPQTSGYSEVPCGDCACLACEGIEIIVGSVRQQVLGLEVFTAFGIEPAERNLLVVKSANHFRAAYAPIAGEIVYMSAPGALTFDFATIPYKRLDSRSYPLVDDSWPVVGGGVP